MDSEIEPFEIKGNGLQDYRDWIREEFPYLETEERYDESNLQDFWDKAVFICHGAGMAIAYCEIHRLDLFQKYGPAFERFVLSVRPGNMRESVNSLSEILEMIGGVNGK